MTEMLTSRKVDFKNQTTSSKSSSKKTSLQLTFHLSEEMKEKLNMDAPVINEDMMELKMREVQKIAESLKKIEAIKAVENIKLEEAKISENRVASSVATEVLAPAAKNEVTEEVYPFLGLKLANQQSVYQVGSSFLHDISEGKRNFGFAGIGPVSITRHLLVYGGFINFSLKKPVLVIVKDINCKSIDSFRSNFTEGTLWKWKTHDWENLCFVDYQELNKYSDELGQIDLSFITTEFCAVVWALSAENIQNELHKATLPILGKLDSVTFVISKGQTKSKQVKKAASYYQCFSIPVKGVLVDEGEV